LQAQHGSVRCGRCATVFDGFKALATLPAAPAPALRDAAMPAAAEAAPVQIVPPPAEPPPAAAASAGPT
jgi:hypothetical protein